MSGSEDTERRESGLSHTTTSRPDRSGRYTTHTHTHTHCLRCVRKWHQSGCPDPHTSTSHHFSLISPVPAAPYRNRFSHKLAVSLTAATMFCLHCSLEQMLSLKKKPLCFVKQEKVQQFLRCNKSFPVQSHIRIIF